MMELSSSVLQGFRQELEKLGESRELGLKGLAIGAALGAGLTYMSADELDEAISKNKGLAVIAGALIGATLLGGAGYFLGREKKSRMDTNQPPKWY